MWLHHEITTLHWPIVLRIIWCRDGFVPNSKLCFDFVTRFVIKVFCPWMLLSFTHGACHLSPKFHYTFRNIPLFSGSKHTILCTLANYISISIFIFRYYYEKDPKVSVMHRFRQYLIYCSFFFTTFSIFLSHQNILVRNLEFWFVACLIMKIQVRKSSYNQLMTW